MTKTETIGDWT